MNDLISRAAVIEAVHDEFDGCLVWDESGKATANEVERIIASLPSAQPEIIRCKDCKHNPKESWLGCPMSHLSEEQRPETAWCWKAERREVEP